MLNNEALLELGLKFGGALLNTAATLNLQLSVLMSLSNLLCDFSAFLRVKNFGFVQKMPAVILSDNRI